jgi:uncharacterized membrane protein
MQAVVDALKAWQLHPVADHFTVAIVVIAVLADLLASLFASRTWIRYMATFLMVVGALAAWSSNVTGGWEASRVWDNVTGPAKDVLKTHAELGDWLPWLITGLAVWRMGIQFLGFIAGLRPLYLLAAIVGVGVLLYQGHEGGELVYTYGVGTAVMPVASNGASPSPEASPTGSPHESPGASTGEPSAIPTVYVPTATPTPQATVPGAAAPAPSASAQPSAAASPPSPAMPASPAATPSASSSATPAKPPAGGASPSASPSPPRSATL